MANLKTINEALQRARERADLADFHSARQLLFPYSDHWKVQDILYQIRREQDALAIFGLTFLEVCAYSKKHGTLPPNLHKSSGNP